MTILNLYILIGNLTFEATVSAVERLRQGSALVEVCLWPVTEAALGDGVREYLLIPLRTTSASISRGELPPLTPLWKSA